jgi:hypothetical protein
MSDSVQTLPPADPADLAVALAFALRFQGRKRVHKADELMAEIVAKRLVDHLERPHLYSQHSESNPPPPGRLRRCLFLEPSPEWYRIALSERVRLAANQIKIPRRQIIEPNDEFRTLHPERATKGTGDLFARNRQEPHLEQEAARATIGRRMRISRFGDVNRRCSAFEV